MKGRLVRTPDLDRGERDAMFDLFALSFESARRALFESDLEEKNQVLLLEDAGGGLQGF